MAIILAKIRYDSYIIADMLGQRTLAMAEHYSSRANRSCKLSNVVEKLDAEMNRRPTKDVKPA